MQLISASLAAAVLGMATIASAHMDMTSPPPLRSSKNKFSTNVDYEMTSPLSPDGSNFPCKGSLDLLGTPQGQSVASWPAGSQQTFTIDGGAFHNGGSCQASLSYDKGKTWTVIHSYIGNCPSGGGPTNYDFTVPADAAAGEAVFAWTWFNNVGNREMYMNCAVVTIGGGKSRKRRGAAMSSRPNMFVANVGNGCGTTEGKDVAFPDPGPDVTNKGSNTAPPTGSCATGGSGSGGSPKPGAGSGGSSSQSSAAAPQPSTSSAVQSSAPAPSSSAVATSSASPTLPGGVYVTVSVTSSASSGAASATGTAPSSGGSASASMPPVASQPTTIATSIRPTAPSNTATAAPSSTDAPAPTGTPAPGGSGSSFAAGSACDTLGSWNCIGGTQFQRCASGNMWSAVQALAAGTKCQPGVSENLAML